MGKYTAKSEMSIAELDGVGTKHVSGWVTGWYVDGYIVGEVIEANSEYITLSHWTPVDKSTLQEELIDEKLDY